MNLAILDYSMLRHVATASVKKNQDMNSAVGHLKCITQSMSEILYSLKTMHNIDKFCFAMDSKPYWRSDYMQQWYKENTEFLTYNETLYWKAYGCYFKKEDDKLKKVTKKELKDAELIEAWDDFETLAEDFPLPRYKGTRVPPDYSWLDCELAQYFDLLAKLPYCYASVLGGRVVDVKGAEADDIAGILTKFAKDKGVKITLISGDSDWQQICAYHDNATFLNPYRDQVYTFADSQEIKLKTMAKIIGGDYGDGIKGCAHTTAYGPIGETKAEKIVEAQSWSEEVVAKYLALNKTLVRLHPDSIPDEVTDAVMANWRAPAEKPIEITWERLQLTEYKRAELEDKAKAEELWAQATNTKEILL